MYYHIYDKKFLWRTIMEIVENFLIWIYKYFWVILFFTIALLIVLMVIANAIHKYKLVKKERERSSKLLKMSYEEDDKYSVAKHIDGETPKNKKYCTVCRSLVDKKAKTCPYCNSPFKTDL